MGGRLPFCAWKNPPELEQIERSKSDFINLSDSIEGEYSEGGVETTTDRPIPARAEGRLSDRAIPSRAEKKKHKEPKIRNSFRRESSSRRESKRDSLSTRNSKIKHSRTRRNSKIKKKKKKDTRKARASLSHQRSSINDEDFRRHSSSSPEQEETDNSSCESWEKAKDLPIPTQFTPKKTKSIVPRSLKLKDEQSLSVQKPSVRKSKHSRGRSQITEISGRKSSDSAFVYSESDKKKKYRSIKILSRNDSDYSMRRARTSVDHLKAGVPTAPGTLVRTQSLPPGSSKKSKLRNKSSRKRKFHKHDDSDETSSNLESDDKESIPNASDSSLKVPKAGGGKKSKKKKKTKRIEIDMIEELSGSTTQVSSLNRDSSEERDEGEEPVSKKKKSKGKSRKGKHRKKSTKSPLKISRSASKRAKSKDAKVKKLRKGKKSDGKQTEKSDPPDIILRQRIDLPSSPVHSVYSCQCTILRLSLLHLQVHRERKIERSLKNGVCTSKCEALNV